VDRLIAHIRSSATRALARVIVGGSDAAPTPRGVARSDAGDVGGEDVDAVSVEVATGPIHV
jgi:hypothetical protein